MKKIYGLMSVMVLGLASCSQDTLNPEESDNGIANSPQTSENSLYNANLAIFKGDESRISYEPGTRAEDDELEPGELRPVLTIANPSKAEGFNFIKEEGGRYLSASSVFFNEADQTYYVTYHMQGNNYNTKLENEIGGAIQTFKINEEGKVELGDGFRAADPDKEDYDFNHLYFDKNDNRIVVVGHKWSVPQSWASSDPFTGVRDNTRAIIGTFNPQNASVSYNTIATNIEVRDDKGMLIDHQDAADANCVIRIYDEYYLATRKGIAVLSAKAENLYQPIKNEDGTNYFVPTPGSCKFVYDAPGDYTRMFYLYLSENKENLAGQTSEAKIAEFKVSTDGSASDSKFLGLINEDTRETFFNSYELDINNYSGLFKTPENLIISPIDGKNALCVIDNRQIYAALGTGGLFFSHEDYYRTGVKTNGIIKDIFGHRPVNFVYADDARGEGYQGGYVYVANGARLTILDRVTMEEVASYTLSAKDGINENEASANFICVVKDPNYDQDKDYPFRERTIIVAYGQAGVKIFKFKPKQSPGFPRN